MRLRRPRGHPSPPEPTPPLPRVPSGPGPGTVLGGRDLTEELRPAPAANAWPDDAVLLTYAELRRLVALHLELCASTMPADRPWDWMRLRAGAVRDGEAPLLIAEVMDP